MSRLVNMALLKAFSVAALIYCCSAASSSKPNFRVIAFYTARADQAHISFVHEAQRWFPEVATKYNFSFDTTSDWHNLNAEFLTKYAVVVFLDTRPEEPAQRAAFQAYMERGGAWMGFHFAGFALTPSAVPANWDWYHNNISRLGILCQQHLATDVGDSSCRRPHASGDVPSPRDISVVAERVVPMGKRSQAESRHRHSAFHRLDELPAWHRPEAERDLAQWVLSRRVDEQEVQDDLPQHGSQRYRLRASVRCDQQDAVIYSD